MTLGGSTGGEELTSVETVEMVHYLLDKKNVGNFITLFHILGDLLIPLFLSTKFFFNHWNNNTNAFDIF